MEKRKFLKKKTKLTEEDEEEITQLELAVAEKWENINRKKVIDNFGDLGGSDGDLKHQGIWKFRENTFQKSNLLC